MEGGGQVKFLASGRGAGFFLASGRVEISGPQAVNSEPSLITMTTYMGPAENNIL